MPFLDPNSHLTRKPYNFDIKCQGNYESYDRHGFFGTKFRGGCIGGAGALGAILSKHCLGAP